MRISTPQSIELIYRISEHLNQIIRNSGKIQINNKQIWNEVLHQLENEHWRGMLETLDLLCEQNPVIGTFSHRNAITSALLILDKYETYYDKVLDIRNAKMNNKPVAWKCTMTMRELYCEACGIDLPNDNTSRVTSTFGEIFDG